jgi:hypothetical protein
MPHAVAANDIALAGLRKADVAKLRSILRIMRANLDAVHDGGTD